MKQLDLFAGIGGISLAAEWAGIETVAFCEKEPFCQKVLRRRFPGRPIFDDVFDLTSEVLRKDGIDRVDIVAGGFPCQPFSHAGKRTGTNDDRYLWPEMLRIVDELKPHWVLAENVEGLVSMAKSDWQLVMEDETTLCEEAEMVLETIRKDLDAIGYQSVPIVIPAAAVGASHRRYRVFIVAHTKSELRGEARKHIDGSAERAAGRSETVADSTGERWGERRAESAWEQRRLCPARCSASNHVVAHSHYERREECDASASGEELGHHPRGVDAGRVHGAGRAIESGVGRGVDELSAWLDGRGLNPLDGIKWFIESYPQPALMGQPQHEWEPPRVTTGAKNRASRLKALGNAVDPLQVFPIFYGIRTIHDYLSQGGY